MLETRPQRRTDYATRAPMQTARPSASRSSPEAALRCAAGAGLDGDPHGRTTLGRAVWCGATNQPLRRRTPPPRTWRDIPDPNHPQFLPTSQNFGADDAPPSLRHEPGHACIFAVAPEQAVTVGATDTELPRRRLDRRLIRLLRGGECRSYARGFALLIAASSRIDR